MPFYYYFDPYYWIILAPAMLIAVLAQLQVSSTFHLQRDPPVPGGI